MYTNKLWLLVCNIFFLSLSLAGFYLFSSFIHSVEYCVCEWLLHCFKTEYFTVGYTLFYYTVCILLNLSRLDKYFWFGFVPVKPVRTHTVLLLLLHLWQAGFSMQRFKLCLGQCADNGWERRNTVPGEHNIVYTYIFCIHIHRILWVYNMSGAAGKHVNYLSRYLA